MIKLETKRLTIRDHIFEDLPEYHELISNEEDMYYLEDIKTNKIDESESSLTEAIRESESGEMREKYFFAITLKDGSYVGEIGYTVNSRDSWNRKNVHLGYFIKKDYWNRGYVTEALLAITDFAFNKNNVLKIETGCLSDNLGSEKVMIKTGFIKESYKPVHQWLKGKWHDRVEYGLTLEDYGKSTKEKL